MATGSEDDLLADFLGEIKAVETTAVTDESGGEASVVAAANGVAQGGKRPAEDAPHGPAKRARPATQVVVASGPVVSRAAEAAAPAAPPRAASASKGAASATTAAAAPAAAAAAEPDPSAAYEDPTWGFGAPSYYDPASAWPHDGGGMAGPPDAYMSGGGYPGGPPQTMTGPYTPGMGMEMGMDARGGMTGPGMMGMGMGMGGQTSLGGAYHGGQLPPGGMMMQGPGGAAVGAAAVGGMPAKPKKHVRVAGGTKWEDPTLNEWPENDFRLFVGDLGTEVTDEALAGAFRKFNSFAKAKIVRESWSHKSKGYGFVSFLDGLEMMRAMREMNGKYLGNRPMKISKSKWKEREIQEVRKKDRKKKKLNKALGIS